MHLQALFTRSSKWVAWTHWPQAAADVYNARLEQSIVASGPLGLFQSLENVRLPRHVFEFYAMWCRLGTAGFGGAEGGLGVSEEG